MQQYEPYDNLPCTLYMHVTGTGCPAGRFGNITGLTVDTDCFECSPGWYCPTIGLVVPHAECTESHYCLLGALSPTPDGESWGYLCPVGHYCPQGIPTPQPCPSGTFKASTGQ